MVRIEVISLFRRGYDTFHPGEIRMVDAADAEHFCRAGWAKATEFATGAADTSAKTLEVQNSQIGQKATKPGVK